MPDRALHVVTRRSLLRVGALGTVVALAGCSSRGGSDIGSGSGSTPTTGGGRLAAGTVVHRPAAVVRTSWSTDPWSLGSYSYLPVGATPALRRTLATPVRDRLVFAGEAVDSDHPSTVHGALASGERAGRLVAGAASRGERIVVVGAGVAGLRAAQVLRDAAASVVVVEARSRLGGRVDTVHPAGWPIPVERGASWVHDVAASGLADRLEALEVATAPFAYELAAVNGARGRLADAAAEALRADGMAAIEGAVEGADEFDRDVSIDDALRSSDDDVDPAALRFARSSELAAEYGADASTLSAWFGLEEGSEGDDVLVLGGYGRLVDDLADGLQVELDRPIERIEWDGGGTAPCRLVDAARQMIEADRVIVTAPLGVLQAGRITFVPDLPAGHREAIAGLGMGLLDKVWVRFDEPFWQETAEQWADVGEAPNPIREWCNLLPATGAPVLLGLVGGDAARALAQRSDDEVTAAVVASLQVFADAGF